MKNIRSRRILAAAALTSCAFAATLVAAPCNTPPTVVPESVTVEVGRPLIVDVLATSSDRDGQALTVSLVSDTCPSQVSAVVDPTQTVTLSASGASSPCQVTYQVSDGAGGTASTELSVSVELTDHIFSDGFESGNTNAWSATQP